MNAGSTQEPKLIWTLPFEPTAAPEPRISGKPSEKPDSCPPGAVEPCPSSWCVADEPWHPKSGLASVFWRSFLRFFPSVFLIHTAFVLVVVFVAVVVLAVAWHVGTIFVVRVHEHRHDDDTGDDNDDYEDED